ncbi:MFS transporter [Streptosporangium sp. NBC_01756]|uniref:MFS transporter n=1 Tax=Streptosporangium sp. NBC_01756 TaxID=2975950 RepID=UPI002DD84505|nr:MFS transporter [Streptosporangium sp. NBC_01756]WSC88550.1 MFS transporter [Streptosporangium sp. NBC_01756]
MRRSHLVLLALSVSAFVVGTAEYIIAGLLPQVASDLHISVGAAGQAVTAYALGVVIGGPLVTILTVRLPRKGLALGLMALFAAGSAVCALAPSYEILLAGRVMSSLSHAAFLALSLVVAVSAVPAERAGRAMAFVISGMTVATLLGVPLGTLLGQQAGWRAPFAVLVVLAGAGIVLLALALPRQPATVTDLRREIGVLARRPVIMAIVTTAVGYSGVAAVFTYIAPMLTEITGFAPPVVSALLLAYGTGSVLGNLAAGRLTDRFPSATLRGVFGSLTVLLVLTPFAVLWKPAAVPAVLALGLLATATITPLQGIILRHAGEAPMLAVSVNVGAFNLAIAFGSVVAGVIVADGGLRWTGLAGAVLSALGLGLSYLAVPRRTAHPAAAVPAT